MFVISKDKINEEFATTSLEHDFKRYMTGFAAALCGSTLPDNEVAFMRHFASDMDTGLDINKNHPDIFGSYLAMKAFIKHWHMTPEDFEYIMLGNMAADKIKPKNPDRYNLDVDLDSICTYGYIPQITKIVSKDPRTIIYFNDGSHVTVKVEKNETFDARQGVYLALLKKAVGSTNLQHILKLLSSVQPVEPKKSISKAPDDSVKSDDIPSVNIDDWDEDYDLWQ